MHELTTSMPDMVFWAATLLLVMRLLTSQDPRWWTAVGAFVGVASENKWNIAFLAAALVIWQAAHGWPELDVFHALDSAAGHNRATYWMAQVLFTGPVLTPVWLAGLIWSLRSQAARRFRPVAIACILVIAVQFILGGKPYYAGAAYTFLLGAGSVPLERWLLARRPLLRRVRPAAIMSALMVVGGVVAAAIAMAALPARTLHTIPLQKINYDLGETIAWPKLTALVAREYEALPAGQRRQTAIITGNYGEAGAIDRYGPGVGLPQAYSGDNNFWLWGPPPAADSAAIAVNLDPSFLRREFAHVRRIATFWNGLGVSDDEQGAAVYLATGLRSSWAQAWPAFRDYS
jgi:hypothetical protein